MIIDIKYTSGIESVDITSDDIFYSNMKDFYINGNAHGLQTNKTEKYDDIMKTCDEIAGFIYSKVDKLKVGVICE